MTDLVVVLAFDPKLEYVALIEEKPDSFFAGKWNGLGGKVDANELPGEAGKREFLEEGGVELDNVLFQGFVEYKTGGLLYFFSSICPRLSEVRSMESQRVKVFSLDNLPELADHVSRVIEISKKRYNEPHLKRERLSRVPIYAPNMDRSFAGMV